MPFKLKPASSFRLPAALVRGMTFIDVIVGTAIMLVVFLAIFGAFKLSIDLIYSTKAKAGALALVADRIEYIRGLPYDSVGTVGGIPAGILPQVAISSLNGLAYTLRTLVAYADDPADGLGDFDENSVTADYKTVKVEALWMVRASARSTFAVTTIAPVGIETLASGGTLRVNAIDALAAPVSGASVRIENSSVVPAIDVTASTNDAGTVSFPGTPVGGGYRITVSKADYSTAETYGSTAENPNPSPGHVAVANYLTSTISLAIDRVGALRVSTYSPPGPSSFVDTFSDESKLSATSSTTVSLGELQLAEAGGNYADSGSAFSVPVSPAYLSSWEAFTATTSVPAEASLTFTIYYLAEGEYAPVPDADLPGNSAGFASTPVDLSLLAPSTYGALEAGAFLATASSTVTPLLLDWSLSYVAGPTPLPGVAFSIRGAKTIGTTAVSSPIYKYTGAITTDPSGEWLIDPIEWDTYTLVPAGPYDVMERCPDVAVVAPGTLAPLSFTMVPHTAQSLKVYVTDSGAALPGAAVALLGSGADEVKNTSACGHAFFGGLPAGEYTVTVSKNGFQPATELITVSGTGELAVPLAP